jgi:hypothetical protein
MNDYPTSSEDEKLLRRTNQFLASPLLAQGITKPQVKISKKKRNHLGLRFNSTKGGGWRKQHVNAYKISV